METGSQSSGFTSHCLPHRENLTRLIECGDIVSGDEINPINPYLVKRPTIITKLPPIVKSSEPSTNLTSVDKMATSKSPNSLINYRSFNLNPSSASSSASSSPPPLPPLPLKSHIGSLLMPQQQQPPSVQQAINSETLVAPKTVNGLKYSPPPLPATSMHLQQQQITNSQPLPTKSCSSSFPATLTTCQLVETELNHHVNFTNSSSSPLSSSSVPLVALPALHSKTPSNASSNTLDSESCFTGPGSSGTLTSNCSSSSGIGSSNTSSSSESTTSSNSSDSSSSNGHSGHPGDPLLLNAITNDHLNDTQMESLSSFPNYPPPPPPPLAPLNPCPSPAPPLPPPPLSTTSSSSVGSHSMKVRVSGSFTGPQPDDTFTMSRVTNFCSPTTDSLSTCSYQRPVSIGAIESISTPSMVRVHSSNQHNYHNGQSHHAHHHHHHQPNHQHHEPIRLSNNCTSENGVSCNQPLFNGRDATLKSSGAHLSNTSNCYNTMIASGLTSSSSPLSTTTTITTTTHKHNALSDNTVSLSDSRQYQANGMVNWRSSSPTNQVKNEMNKVNGNSLCDLRSTDANKLSESWSLRQPGSTSMGQQYQATPIDPNCTSTSTINTTFSFPFPSAPFNKCVKRSIASDEVQRVNSNDDDINSKNVINENCVLNSTIKLIRQSNECKESDESNVIGRVEAIGSSSTASSDGYSSGSLSPTSSPSSLELALDRPYIVHSMCGQPILSNSSEAIPKLTEHLDCLKAEYSQMQSEIQTNESIGASLVERLTQAGLTWQETEKISIHLEEIEKITRLLLSLSTRLKSIEADISSKNVSSPLGGGGNPSGSTHNNNNNVGCEKLVSSSLFSSSSSTSCSSALYFNKQSLTSSSSSGCLVTSIHNNNHNNNNNINANANNNNNNHHPLPSSASSSSLLLSSHPSSSIAASASVFLDNRIDNRCNKNVNPELESLLLKRNKLLAQLEEAIALKESIDRTSQTISDKIIVKYFKQSSQDVDSFVRFIQLKSKLIVEEKELIDKIEIKERQLLNLTNAT